MRHIHEMKHKNIGLKNNEKQGTNRVIAEHLTTIHEKLLKIGAVKWTEVRCTVAEIIDFRI